MSDWNSLQEWSRTAAGLELSDGVVGQLRRYVDALRVWNRKMALVARADLSTILDKLNRLPDVIEARREQSGGIVPSA